MSYYGSRADDKDLPCDSQFQIARNRAERLFIYAKFPPDLHENRVGSVFDGGLETLRWCQLTQVLVVKRGFPISRILARNPFHFGWV